MNSVKTSSVLLVIGGGIAAYKSLELIRLLKGHGIGVTAILTKSGAEFVTALSVASLTGNKVYTDLFSLTDETEIGHIELSRSADLIVVVPATADLMAKMASGLANDLASTALLATDKPVLIAPAMNVRMWQHPATQRNLATLRRDAVTVIGPNDGEMACGEFGPGRMAEPAEIAAAIVAALAPPAARPLTGKKVVITAGPTREPIDPVRYISNHSSGKQGYAIAEAAVALGAETVLISGPVSRPIPPGAGMIPVESARDMLAAVEAELPCDIAIFAAAVADWRVAEAVTAKIKKEEGAAPPSLAMVENPDILRTIGHLKAKRPALVVGFAAETGNVVDYARAKLAKKGADLMVANDVSPGTMTFGGDNNKVWIVSPEGTEIWPPMSKRDVAQKLMAKLADRLGGAPR